MVRRNIAMAVAGLSLLSSPVVAQTTSDTSMTTGDDEGIGQVAYGVLFGILALAIGLAVSGGGANDDPVSA